MTMMERVKMNVFEQDKKEMGTEEGPFGPGGSKGWIRGCFFCARVAQADPRCHLCILCPSCMAHQKQDLFSRAPSWLSLDSNHHTCLAELTMMMDRWAMWLTGPMSVHRSRYAQHVSLPLARHLYGCTRVGGRRKLVLVLISDKMSYSKSF